VEESDAPPFGARLYAELTALGRRSFITDRLKYSQIQRLKAASREEVVALFAGSGPRVIERIRSEEPHPLALYLIGFDDGRDHGAAQALVIFGIT